MKTEIEQMNEYALNNMLPGTNTDESLLDMARLQKETFERYQQPEFFEGHSEEAIQKFCKEISKAIKNFSFFLIDFERNGYKNPQY